MLFRHCLFFVSTALLTFSVAIPILHPGEDFSLERRETLNFELGLAARALSPAQKANAALRAQSKKPIARQHKKANNKKITDKVAKPKTAGYSKLNADGRKKADTANTKQHNRMKNQAITKAQKDAKAARSAKWAAAKKTTYTKKPRAPKAPKVSKATKAADRNQVKTELRGAASRMKNTANLPGRKDQFEVGGKTYSGKDARKAVMNSHLNERTPVGNTSRHPKSFRNDPYSPTHGDTSLRGKRPIAGNPAGLKEYPVTQNGWTGKGSVGPARVITSNQGGRDTFHGVIGHDTKRGGDKDDHYHATHTKAKRELDESEYENY